MPPKRKRTADLSGGRPSPHRPNDTNMANHDRGRTASGARSARRSDRHDTGPSAGSNAASPLNSPSLARPSSASSQAATVPSAPSAPAATSPALPSPVQSGYHYDIVTDARLGKWAQGGRQELVEHGIQSRDDEDMQELSTIFQELLKSSLDYRLRASEAGDVTREILGPRDPDASTSTFDTHTLFLDTVSIFLDVEASTSSAILRDFMIATNIDPALMRRVLEPPVLEQLGLIRETFTKMGIRQATNILYKQANYNLLREETEGYAKLATELFTTCNHQAPSSEAVQAAFERVKGLIGTFDLDVGRVLDVLLDVFASVLIKQNRFFVKFLRISSWWPRSYNKTSLFCGGLPKWALPESAHWQTSEEDEQILNSQRLQRDIQFWHRAREAHLKAYFELGGRQIQGPELQRIKSVSGLGDHVSDDVSHLDADSQWILTTNTLPPQGNRVAAQLLGFKLRFYESDNVRDKEVDVIPANLFYMTALLIKIGFISLADLWPHLSADDSAMEAHRREREKVLEEEERKRTGRGNNALTMSVLTDDTPSGLGPPSARPLSQVKAANAADDTDKDKDPKYPPQKVQLLTELLTMGAIPEAVYVLTRYPWLPEAYPGLYKLINRLLSHSVQKVFEEGRVGSVASPNQLEIPAKRLPDPDQTGVSKGSVRLGQTQQRRPFRWPHPDGESNNTPYRFYWDEWADNVPVCQTVDDVFTLCDTLMNLSGVNIGRDATLLAKLASIGAMSLAQDQSLQNFSRWQDLLTRLLVPALSLTEANSFVVHAVWDLLKLFPITTRYAIYSEWFLGRTSRNPAIKAAFARTKTETNSVLKRLSLTNLTAMAKKLAKTAYSSPGIVFKTAFDQIEAYPNLIQAFVECAKYFTDLGYDVLTWSLMSALGGKSRSRTQEVSVLLTSKWLQALSKFSGRVFKRYQNMTPGPVLQYVHSQLLNGNSTDLVILRELILSMAGVVSDVDFTDAQLQAMTGGEVLRRQTLIKLGDHRFEYVNGSKRLMQSLIDTKLAGRLLVNMAQYRQAALYRDDAHVKYLATIMDEVQQALVQYLDLLRSNMAPDDFDRLIPGIAELMTTYGLDVNLAFMIGRASLAHRMANIKAPVVSLAKDGRSTTQSTPQTADTDGDVAMNENGIDNPADDSVPIKDEAEDKMAIDDKPAPENAMDTSAPLTSETRKHDPIADVLQPIVDTIQDGLPSATWQNLSPEFYVTFWSLSLGDLHVPQNSYEAENDRLHKEANEVMKDRSDMTRQGMNKKEEKKKGLQALAQSIREELGNHISRYQKTKFRLARQAKFWFSNSITDAAEIADALLEYCLLPRLLMSASDTEYCFRMIKFLHENQTPNFKLFTLYEQLFNANRLRAMIFSATVREAEHWGRFFRCILEDLARWHADKAVYEKEAFGSKRKYLGFATAFDEDGSPTAFVEHPFFKDAHYEWHKNFNIALKACLQGTKEWMHIRNALTILKWVAEFFPAVNFMGSQLLKVLDDIKTREDGSKGPQEEGHRVDLSVAAQTVYAMLKRQDSKWVAVQAFRPNMSVTPQDGSKDVDMTTTASSASQRANAADSKSQQSANVTTSTLPLEDEDGEVKDNKESRVSTAQKDQSTAGSSDGRLTAHESKESDSGDKLVAQGSRHSTPKPAPALPAPPAMANGRNDHARSSRQDRVPHGLPNRPNVPIPGRFLPQHGAPEQRRDLPTRDTRDPKQASRDSREPRDPRERHRDPRETAREAREPRDARPQDVMRGDKRDHPEGERRGNDNAPTREPGRHSEWEWQNRPEAAPRRIEVPNDRDPRDSRSSRAHSRDNRASSREQIPPPTQSQEPVSEMPVNPQRAALIQADERSNMANQQRPPFVQNSPSTSSTRSPRDSGRDRGSSRTSSPRREERPSREERHGRRSGAVAEPPQPSAAPRDNETHRDPSRPSSDRGRDASHTGQSSRTHDSERGRPVQQDPNYGRLNPIPSVVPVADPTPQGPRGRGARSSNRGAPTPSAPRSDGRMLPPDVPRAPSPERQPPTGPRSRRPPAQADVAQQQAGNNHSSSSNSSSNSNSNMHMSNSNPHIERVKQFEPNPNQVPVHPDRMNHIFASPPPPPPQQGSSSSRSRHNMPPPIHTNDRMQAPSGPSAQSGPQGPQGPRHGQSSMPNTPVAEQHHHNNNHNSSHNSNNNSNSNAPYSAPTGPAASHDRQRGSARRQLQDLQNSLTANNSRREADYRRQRASMPDSDAQILTGASPVTTPIHERTDPTRRGGSGLPDRPHGAMDNDGPLLSRDSSGRSSGPPHVGEDNNPGSSGRPDYERSNGRRDHRERSERSSRHGGGGSSSSGRDRSPRGERSDPREMRDHQPRSSDNNHERHDRRAGGGGVGGPPPGMEMSARDSDPNYEPIQPRRSMRDAAATGGGGGGGHGGSGSRGEPMLPPHAREPQGPGRDSRHRGPRGDHGGRGDMSIGGGSNNNNNNRGLMRGGHRDAGSRDGGGHSNGPRPSSSMRLGGGGGGGGGHDEHHRRDHPRSGDDPRMQPSSGSGSGSGSGAGSVSGSRKRRNDVPPEMQPPHDSREKRPRR
ncbi:transcription factor/nuclear export subunit protein 2-domain-containing protein [Coniella lustricola]|uniref:THO complex subunit 2 n=1 Tax=Coniella lustricola TaxID=2025994 RepID=A0A2T3AKS2_9PEZI|nr:transcription factor/nuclear export subunit protein 2-domain-containing protein [Coniella lustricola]